MKKTYRISVYNKARGSRELMWERFTSRKSAQALADKMNELDDAQLIDARVFMEVR